MSIHLNVPLVSVVDARKKVEDVGYWTRDEDTRSVELVAIPEVKKTRVGVRFLEDETPITFPVADRKGLRSLLGVHERGLLEYIDDEGLVRQMFQHCLNKRTGQTIRFVGQEGQVTSVREPKGKFISPLEVFDMVVDEIGCTQVEKVEVQRNDLRIRFIGEFNDHRPKDVGDISHAGIVVRMNARLCIGAYCYRMVCRNGMMRVYEKLDYPELGEIAASTVRTTIQSQHASARELLGDFMSLDEVSVESPEQTMVQLGHQFHLPRRITSKAIEMIPELPSEATQYDLMNILLVIARDVKRNDRLMMRLGEATKVVAQENARCSHCGSILPQN